MFWYGGEGERLRVGASWSIKTLNRKFQKGLNNKFLSFDTIFHATYFCFVIIALINILYIF